jgi:molybdopterin synthase catalytic subunit
MDALHVAVVERRVAVLDVAAALDFVADPRFGGIASFIGRVRDHNVGRSVTGITYPTFVPLSPNHLRAIA